MPLKPLLYIFFVGEKRIKRHIVYSLPSLSVTIDVPIDGKWKTITANTCKRLPEYYPELEKGGCMGKPDDWEYHCGAKTKTCIYNVKCKFDSSVEKIRCQETHFFTGWTCCDVACP